MRAASAELLVLPAGRLTPKSPPKARPEIAPVKMPKIAPVDYAAILDREQAAFDAAEFTTADLDAPAPYVGVGSAQDPLVVRLRNLRRRSWLSRVRGSRWSGTDAELARSADARSACGEPHLAAALLHSALRVLALSPSEHAHAQELLAAAPLLRYEDGRLREQAPWRVVSGK